MQSFGFTGKEKKKLEDRNKAILGLLRQSPSEQISLAHQTIGLFALQNGMLDGMSSQEAQTKIDACITTVKETAPMLLLTIEAHPDKLLSQDTLSQLDHILRS